MRNFKFLVAALAFALLFTACNKDDKLLNNEYLIDGVKYEIKSASWSIQNYLGSQYHSIILTPEVIPDFTQDAATKFFRVFIPSSLLEKAVNLKTTTSFWQFYFRGHSDEIELAADNKEHLISGTLLVSKKGDEYTITFTMKVMVGEKEIETSGHYSGTPQDMNFG